MNEKTLTFYQSPDLSPSPKDQFKLVFPDPKSNNEDSSADSGGTVASEVALQVGVNEFNFNRTNYNVMNSCSRNTIQLKEQGGQSLVQTDIVETTQKPSSLLHPDYSEHVNSRSSNMSLPSFPVTPTAGTGGNNPYNALARRPSKFFASVNEDKMSLNAAQEHTRNPKMRMTPAFVSKSHEFLQMQPEFDSNSYAEPLTSTLSDKKPRPSMMSGFKGQNVYKGLKDSQRALSPSQINLIDDKVSSNSEPRRLNFLSPGLERQKTRKSKLLDRISLIAAKGDSGEDSPVNNPAMIFKQVLQKVNPVVLQKAEKSLRRRLLISLKKKIMKLVKAPFQVFSPEESLIHFWNIITPLMVAIDTFFTPFVTSFYIEDKHDRFVGVAGMIGIFFIIDIMVNFRTAFYERGLLITESKLVTRHYLRRKFAADFIVVITDILSVFYSDTPVWYVKFFSIIRLKKLWNVMTRAEDTVIMSRVFHAMIKMLKLGGSIIIVAHWFACLFHMVAYARSSSELTWLQTNHLLPSTVLDRYIAAFYWSIATMTSVGYGDIIPISNTERVYVVVTMIISSVMFGYSLSTVGDIIREMSYEKDQRREKIRSFRKYMNQKSLGKDIQIRVKNYMQYMIESRMLYKNDDEEFFELLSQNLKDEIISEVNGKILNESKLFSVNFTAKAASCLATYMKEMFKSPEEIIFNEDDQEDYSIYFIVYGKVQIDYRAKKVKVLEKGTNFGEMSFFSGQPRNARAKSLFFTNLYALKREVANEKLKALPSDFETFHFIKDSMNLYKNYTHLQITCYSCDRPGHVARNCPEIHYTADREEIIRNYLNKQYTFQKKFKRNIRPKFRVRSNLSALNETVKMIQEDYNDYTLSDEELSQDSLDVILERNLILVPGGELNDMRNRKLDRKRKSARASINLVYEQVASANDIIGRRTSQLLTKNMLGEENLNESMALKTSSGEYIFFSIDKVENFELYFPQNNVIKIITELEKYMFEQLLESKQGVAKALVIRNFGAMLRSNKGPHKSPLFYANLKKEIQRGRKKITEETPKPQPVRRLKTLMEDAIHDNKKRMTPNNSKLKILESGDESQFMSGTYYSGDSNQDLGNVLKGEMDDAATISKSDRLMERKGTNPSLFMNKLGSLNPKMMNRGDSDANKVTSRNSIVESMQSRGTLKNADKGRKHTFMSFVDLKNEEDRGKRSKNRTGSRCSSQGRIDDMQKLVDKIDLGADLFKNMLETKLTTKATANFGE